MLVPRRLPNDADFLQADPRLRALLPVLVRQVIAERAIGEAQPEVVEHLRMIEAAPLQVGQSLRAVLQRLLVVAEDILHYPLIVGVRLEQRFELHRRRRALGDHAHRRGQRWMLVAQQFGGVTETHAASLHHPVDDRASGLAGAETVPEIGFRADDQRRLVIVVERAQAQQVRAVPLQFDALRFHQPLQGNLPLHALDVLVGNPRHPGLLS